MCMFFCFTQKTAYEMRISDWSSDVCSSDLWTDHMTTVFPEIRLKHFIEMRGADGGPWHRLCALPALWVGLLYDDTALDAAWDLCKGWSAEELARLRDGVRRHALKTPFRDRKSGG